MKKRWIIALVGTGVMAFGSAPQMTRGSQEPSEWAMMLSGLGLVALGLTRRSRLDIAIDRRGAGADGELR